MVLPPIGSGPPRNRTRLARLVHLALGAGICGSAGTAFANDACTVVSGTHTYQCSGNQSAGITFTGVSSPAGTLPTSATGLNITNLNSDVTGTPTIVLSTGNLTGAVVVSIPSTVTASWPIILNGPTHGIKLPSALGSGITVSALSQTFTSAPTATLSLVLNGPLTAGGPNQSAVSVLSTGEKGSSGSGDGGKGGTGHFARDVSMTMGQSVTLSGTTTPAFAGTLTMLGSASSNTSAPAINLQSIGGSGGPGANASDDGGGGGPGQAGGNVSLNFGSAWTITGSPAGILMISKGGSGAGGGEGTFGSGGLGGPGGAGNSATLSAPSATPTITITTQAASAPGIQLFSEGGNGGNGGSAATFSSGGKGGAGGSSGFASISGITPVITTHGANSAGLGAFSLGGIGGNGGGGGFFTGGGGSGGGSGTASGVTIGAFTQFLQGRITTFGADSPGVIGQSVAGHGGASGSAYGFVNFGGSGGSAGYSGGVEVYSNTQITTTSDRSPALSAQSIGGGGGNGGSGFGVFFAQGSNGGNGGDGSIVEVQSTNNLTTSGADSHGIYAQSIGGAGGDGGWAGGVVSVGGKGATASNGSSVTVSMEGVIVTGAATTSTISPSANPICGVGCSSGIVAQSIGGGGGNGGSTGGWFPIGGSAGGGGSGGEVQVFVDPFSPTGQTSSVTTNLPQSYGILAQSIGGGGGNGGMAVGAGAWVSAAVGGSGGSGGSGGQALVLLNAIGTAQPSITTKGDKSPAIMVQSLGGGGGNGGFAIDVAAGKYLSASVAIGGSGDVGGDASIARFNYFSDGTPNNLSCCTFVTTFGASSPGITVQSLGGGGGNGGFAISADASAQGIGGSVAVGGFGKGGGNGGQAEAWSDSTIKTQGDDSPGLQVQSAGGGGGNGGLSVAGTVSLGTSLGFAAAIGGSGGSGGSGGGASAVANSGQITTAGARSDGINVQSIGGGGGRGGLSVAATLTASSGSNVPIGVSVGGSGGTGGWAGGVSLTSNATVTVSGSDSRALVAQSVGGGGGSGNAAVSGAVSIATSGGGASFSVGLGGSGGAAGNGSWVDVTNTGVLQTSSQANALADSSAGGQGILAQSIGGGGGSGGWAGVLSATVGDSGAVALSAALGGAGGAGGNASWVDVHNSGAITTWSTNSEAILAQSTGGGGGNAGGIANLTLAKTTGSSGQGLAGGINIGQSGGGGGQSDTVTVTNTSALTTHGANSAAISAQSHGGGGGNAGYIFNVDVVAGTQTKNADFNVTLGGSGGTGRSAGTVTVNSSAPLATFGDSSPGVLAQSIGGGGGNANYTVAVSPASSASVVSAGASVAIGGSGGSGATSAKVAVTNTGAITTGQLDGTTVIGGNASHGIIAQSVGGGGGSAQMTMGVTPTQSWNAEVNVGGTGATGANAGEVDVTNSGSIVVLGNSAAGLVARSIGGGGGDSQATSVSVAGGGSTTGNKSANLNVTVGLAGASGGTGGPVTVVNNAPITTSSVPSTSTVPADPPLGWQAPINSYGIFAQSVGGSGGAGGAAIQMIPSLEASNTTLNASVSVGGQGGSGAISGTVSVTNTASITTSQTESHGIVAQSVGGGGGKGGAAAALASSLYNSRSSVLNVGVAVGGKGGTGNDANTVTVTNNGNINIQTSGTSAHAVFAQSIGGGGGDGGSAAALALGVNNPNNFTDAMQFTMNVAVGGNGGGGGSGKAVTVNNTATTRTRGDDAIGILAQSVGGGGGIGGGGSTLTTFPLTSLSVAVGGKGGAAGDGGKVVVNHFDWGLLTSGANAPAIYAQSIGGGGGRGGVGLYTPLITFPIGGTGGSSGNGGEVDVYVAFGGVQTSGSGRGYGIFAQSVGGGGGEAGGTGVGIVDPVYPQGAPVLSMANSSSTTLGNGSGGPVTVTVEKTPVTTSGNDAIGIFAQSVGGGGGVAGQTATGCTDTTKPCGYQVGSTGGTGNGGLVTVALKQSSSVGASVTTSGQYSHGIFAQSAAGNTGTAAGVAVTITGSSVHASGAGASGIFANSAGGGASGPIQITLDAGSTVSGGTSTASTGAAGIRLVDGHANTITNAGTITAVNGVNGVAIRTDRGNPADFSNVVTTVNNSGTITGSTQAGTNTTLTINNQSGGTLVAGTQMALGGGTLTNAGVVEIGGPRRFGTTRLEGTLVQTSAGRLVVDLAPFRRGIGTLIDRIEVIGRAQLAGKLDVRLADFGEGGHGPQRVTLIEATEGVDFTGLSVTPSAVAQYRLVPGSLMLSYEVNFANPLLAPALSAPQMGVGSYLEALHVANALPADFGYLLAIGTAAEYGQSLDRLSPQAYATNLWGAQLAATQFNSTMLDCRNRSTNERVLTEGTCFAGGVSGWKFDRDNDGSAGYELSSGQFSIGAERQLSPEWAFGGAIGYDRLRNQGDAGFWSGDANLFHAGAFARRHFAEFALTAAAIGGFSKPKMDRYPTPTTRAHGDQDLTWFGGTLRAERPFAVAHGTLRPMLDLNVLRVKSDGFTESGGLTALQVSSEHETNWSVRPALEWSMDLKRSDASVLRPRVVVGVTRYLNDPSPALSASFLGVGAGAAAPMQVSSEVSKTYADVLLGVDIHAQGRLTVGANLFGQFSRRSHQIGGGLEVKMAF